MMKRWAAPLVGVLRPAYEAQGPAWCAPIVHAMTRISAAVAGWVKLAVDYPQQGRVYREHAMLTAIDLKHLRRCVELARKALVTGNPPFGSLLVDADGDVLFEDYNQIQGSDRTHHPEMGVARWATAHLTPAERARTTVYTSGEHCAMCAAAHGWVGLGRIVYATSSAQLADWLAEWKIPRSRVRDLSIQQVLSGVEVAGPAPTLVAEIRGLHYQFFQPQAAK